MNEFEEKLKKANETVSLKIWKEWRELTGCGQTCFLCGSKIPIVCPLLKFCMNSENHQKPLTKERAMATTKAHLAAVLEWAKGYRGDKRGNPYCVPEIKAALKHLAEIEGIEDYLDVDTASIAAKLHLTPSSCPDES